ncbi:MAG: hypothetical protein ACOYBR_04425 [Fluviibacter sp.]
MKRIKSDFSDQFQRCLKAFYKGRLPSFASIARDFSLRAPHLPHVSAETVRHWVRGSSLPHVSRMQVLVDWLGPEVAATFDTHARALLSGRPGNQSNQLFAQTGRYQSDAASLTGTQTSSENLLVVLDRLTEQERQAVMDIAQLLLVKHHSSQQPNSDDEQALLPEC